MSSFAGVVSRSERPIPADARETIRRTLSRRRAPLSEFDEPTAYVASLAADPLHVGAGLQADDAGVAVVAGDPLFPTPAVGPTPSAVAALRRALADGGDARLAEARGTFCGARWERGAVGAPGTLHLVVDAMGVRPLYVAEAGDLVAFATSLRVLVALPFVSRALDVRGVAEQAGLSLSLGARTVFRDVSMLRSGEIVQVRGERLSRRAYRAWTSVPVAARTLDDATADAYDAFVDAVRLRRCGDAATIAFLSGGLDSRVIVTALRDQGARVHTFNFSPAGSLDAVLGAQFAAVMGTEHVSRTNGTPFPDWTAMMRAAIELSAAVQRDAEIARPDACWSGDGGSVCVGHEYLTPRIVGRLERDDLPGAVDAFLADVGAVVPTRIVRAADRALARDALRAGVLEELARIDCPDAVRRFHLFLLHNDQRRHLVRHFEHADEHGLEFQLPFFDAAFLERVLAAPCGESLYHHFYARWLRHFPPVATSVPWQPYPGHVPCPLPLPRTHRAQWGRTGSYMATAAARRRLTLAATSTLLRRREFPSVLDRRGLRIAYVLERCGLRDQRYVLEAAQRVAAWLP